MLNSIKQNHFKTSNITNLSYQYMEVPQTKSPQKFVVFSSTSNITNLSYRNGDKDLNPFDMSYAAMVGLDFQHAFDDPLVSPRLPDLWLGA
jgi:hypothetical protein